jgi:3-hydroxyacyl-CoA dehydrogenase
VHRLCPEDEKRDMFVPPAFLRAMLEKRLLGDKAGQGFYKKVKNDRLVLDLQSLEHRPARPPDLPALEEARKIRDAGERIRHLLGRDDRAGRFLWDTFSELFLYSARRIPEITDDLISIDTTMRNGFNWEMGLFEIWDAVGVEDSARRMEKEGKPLAPLVEKLLASGAATFYRQEKDQRFYFDLRTASHQPIPPPPGVMSLAALRRRDKVVKTNKSASLLDAGDGILCLEFHSKANSIDPDVIDMLRAALEETEAHYEGLVIGNEGANFCVGANLQYVLEVARAGRFEEIRRAVETMQNTVLSVRACRKPVVAAVFGQTLAGGCEVAMHCARVQAAAETYMGLVEMGVGLVPGAGGTKEVLMRAASLKDAFELIGMAKVSGSAAEAAEWGFLRPVDPITMNRDRLMEDARQTALAMARAGYLPPAAAPLVPVAGRAGLASLKLSLHMMKEAGYITDYDAEVGRRLAYVLSGGDLPEPASVPESYLLELEREAFVALCGEPKTQQRMEHLLKTGRPLRN